MKAHRGQLIGAPSELINTDETVHAIHPLTLLPSRCSRLKMLCDAGKPHHQKFCRNFTGAHTCHLVCFGFSHGRLHTNTVSVFSYASVYSLFVLCLLFLNDKKQCPEEIRKLLLFLTFRSLAGPTLYIFYFFSKCRFSLSSPIIKCQSQLSLPCYAAHWSVFLSSEFYGFFSNISTTYTSTDQCSKSSLPRN